MSLTKDHTVGEEGGEDANSDLTPGLLSWTLNGAAGAHRGFWVVPSARGQFLTGSLHASLHRSLEKAEVCGLSSAYPLPRGLGHVKCSRFKHPISPGAKTTLLKTWLRVTPIPQLRDTG